MYHNAPTSVTNGLALIAFLIASGGMKGFYAAWTAVESDPMFKIQPTQRARYVMLTFGTLVSFGSTLYLLLVHGWSQFTLGLNDWWGTNTAPIGYIINICVWFGLFSPVLTVLTAIHIYRRPCQMARRIRRPIKGWIATRDVRQRVSPKAVYRIDKFWTYHGPTKRYIPTGYTV